MCLDYGISEFRSVCRLITRVVLIMLGSRPSVAPLKVVALFSMIIGKRTCIIHFRFPIRLLACWEDDLSPHSRIT